MHMCSSSAGRYLSLWHFSPALHLFVTLNEPFTFDMVTSRRATLLSRRPLVDHGNVSDDCKEAFRLIEVLLPQRNEWCDHSACHPFASAFTSRQPRCHSIGIPEKRSMTFYDWSMLGEDTMVVVSGNRSEILECFVVFAVFGYASCSMLMFICVYHLFLHSNQLDESLIQHLAWHPSALRANLASAECVSGYDI